MNFESTAYKIMQYSMASILVHEVLQEAKVKQIAESGEPPLFLDFVRLSFLLNFSSFPRHLSTPSST